MRHGTTEDIKLAVRLAIEVLQEPDPFKKAELTEKHFKTIEKWRTEGGAGEAEEKTPDAEPLSAVPDKPRRSDLVNIVESRRMKSLGKGGSLKSRMAIVHSLAHIESWVSKPSLPLSLPPSLSLSLYLHLYLLLTPICVCLLPFLDLTPSPHTHRPST